MNIKELNEIISHIDLVQINAMLEQSGYRCASKNGTWEYDPISIANAEKIQNSNRYEDVFDDKIYIAEIYSKIKSYPNKEFIVITVKKVYRDKNNYESPIEMILYTNAPIDKIYEEEQSKIAQCVLCKKSYRMGELCEINNKLICDNCFKKDLQSLKSKGKSKLI